MKEVKWYGIGHDGPFPIDNEFINNFSDDITGVLVVMTRYWTDQINDSIHTGKLKDAMSEAINKYGKKSVHYIAYTICDENEIEDIYNEFLKNPIIKYLHKDPAYDG